MSLNIFEISLLVLAGALISIGAGMFKDWLKNVIPKSFAYWGAVLFIAGAITSIIINSRRKENFITPNKKENISKPSIKKPTILVFCDITPSQDPNEIEMVISTSEGIIRKYNDANIYFYPVSNNLYTTELFHVKPYNSAFEGIKYEEGIRKKILFKYSSSENIIEESCVTKSFVVAYNKLKELKVSQDDKSFIVFVSDMMEYCTYDEGLINLANKSSLMRNYQILDSVKPGFNLGQWGTEVAVVMTVSKKLALDEKAHLNFWHHAFGNVGFVDSLFSKIIFTTGLPNLSLE